MEESPRMYSFRSRGWIPREARQVDGTYLDSREKTFPEAQEAFARLREEYQQRFSGDPLVYLRLVRAIADRLVMLAIEKRLPVHDCLNHLQRRMDLEYDRAEIFGKAAQQLILANYAVESGDLELGKTLLEEERAQLQETLDVCRNWLETLARRSAQIDEVGRPPSSG
jgi:hypothetical protein